jgi:hypothetical protein
MSEAVCLCGVKVKRIDNELKTYYTCARQECGFCICSQASNYTTYMDFFKVFKDNEYMIKAPRCCGMVCALNILTVENVGMQFIYNCTLCGDDISLIRLIEKENQGRGIKCLCGKRCQYLKAAKTYACSNMEQICGFYVHKLDSMTLWAIKSLDCEEFGWLKKYPSICKCDQLCVYRYDNEIKELVFACKKNQCKFIDKNIYAY